MQNRLNKCILVDCELLLFAMETKFYFLVQAPNADTWNSQNNFILEVASCVEGTSLVQSLNI